MAPISFLSRHKIQPGRHQDSEVLGRSAIPLKQKTGSNSHARATVTQYAHYSFTTARSSFHICPWLFVWRTEGQSHLPRRFLSGFPYFLFGENQDAFMHFRSSVRRLFNPSVLCTVGSISSPGPLNTKGVQSLSYPCRATRCKRISRTLVL